MKSIFEYRKPVTRQEPKDSLAALRETLEQLNAEATETPQTADLKRILMARIEEIERKLA